MPDSPPLSDSKRKLLEKYLVGRDLNDLSTHSISSRPDPHSAPLAYSQEQVVRQADRLNGLPHLFNECFTLHRTGPLNVATLSHCLGEILRRHEIWRTSYALLGEESVQTINPTPSSYEIPFVDLRGVAATDVEITAHKLASDDASRPFDLRTGPLVRTLLLQTSEHQFRLYFTIHQSVVDGISVFRILPLELTALYQAFSVGNPSALPELPIQFGDYAYWQRHSLSREVLEKQLIYWREQLGGDLPTLNWPVHRARPASQSYRGELYPFVWSRQFANSLQQLAKQQKVTLFAVLLAGFAALLHLYTAEEDIAVGTLSPSGRKRPEVQNLLGYFLNPVALRIPVQDGFTFRDLLKHALRITSEALANDDITLQQIIDDLKLPTQASRSPIFQLAISLGPDSVELPTGWSQTYMDVGSGGARWDLYLEFSDRPTGLLGRAQYNPDLFDVSSIEQLTSDLKRLLQSAYSNPDSLLPRLLD